METFRLSVNKAHSVCYSVISYKEAWMSHYYPIEFAVGNCTVNNDSERIQATLSLARKRKIPIYSCDINHSGTGFSIETVLPKGIRYGLQAITGIGVVAIDFIFKIRYALNYMQFKDFDEYYNMIHNSKEAIAIIKEIQARTGVRTPNPMKRNVEIALILSGCFDYCEPNRYKLCNHYIQDIRREKNVKPYDEKKYTRNIKLALEKEYMGDFISEHPLDGFAYYDVDSCSEGETIETAAIMISAALKSTKKGNQYLTLKVKTKDERERNINFFNEEQSISLKKDLKKNQIIIIKGKVSKQYNNISASSIKIAVASKQIDGALDILTINDYTVPKEEFEVKNTNTGFEFRNLFDVETPSDDSESC